MIDDSLVRGTTAGPLVQLLREAGATEVHVRITCPPITNACHFGVDMGHDDDLIAARLTVEEIRRPRSAPTRCIPVARRDDAAISATGDRATATLLHRRYPSRSASRRQARLRSACPVDQTAPGRSSPFEGAPGDEGRRGRRRRAGAGDRVGLPARHGHDVTRRRRARRRPRRRREPSTWSSSGPRSRSPTASPTRCAAAGIAVLRADRGARPARDVEGLHPGARRAARHPVAAVLPQRPPTDDAIAWWRQLGAAGRRQARRPRRRQGRHRARRRRPRPTRRSGQLVGTGPIVLEERLRGPECCLLALCDGTRRPAAAARAGPQADRRGRHRPEHRRHGRLRPGARAVRRRRADRDVHPARARPPRARAARRTSACSTPG